MSGSADKNTKSVQSPPALCHGQDSRTFLYDQAWEQFLRDELQGNDAGWKTFVWTEGKNTYEPDILVYNAAGEKAPEKLVETYRAYIRAYLMHYNTKKAADDASVFSSARLVNHPNTGWLTGKSKSELDSYVASKVPASSLAGTDFSK